MIALTGLAIDVGMAYTVQTKLNAALDAAVIAAGRAISKGTAAAKQEAANLFKANYPSGLLGASVSDPEIATAQNPDGSWTITATGRASSPTYFAQVIGVDKFDVSSSATSTVRTLDMVLVLDTSSSLNDPATTPDLLKAAANDFIGNFNTASDRVGLIHFASGTVTDVPITSARGFSSTAIESAIRTISVNGSTTAEEALRQAKAQLDGISADSQSSLRAIVFFTDGAPNGVAGNFQNGGSAVRGALYSEKESGTGPPSQLFDKDHQNKKLGDYRSIANLPTTDWTNTVPLASYNNMRPAFDLKNTRCNVNRAARNMLENVANQARSEGNPIQIFTIGLGASLTNLEIKFCSYDAAEESGENILKRLANVPGVDTYNASQPMGFYAYAADASELQSAFNKVASALLRISK